MSNLRVETKRELVTEDGKRFNVFDDIAFSIYNNMTNHKDHVICRIIGFSDSDYKKDNGFIIVDNVEINREKDNQCMFAFKDMMDINYVYYD